MSTRWFRPSGWRIPSARVSAGFDLLCRSGGIATLPAEIWFNTRTRTACLLVPTTRFFPACFHCQWASIVCIFGSRVGVERSFLDMRSQELHSWKARNRLILARRSCGISARSSIRSERFSSLFAHQHSSCDAEFGEKSAPHPTFWPALLRRLDRRFRGSLALPRGFAAHNTPGQELSRSR